MPYRVSKQSCKRSDGKKGSYVLKYKPKKPTKKKKDGEGYVKAGCHTSKQNAHDQRAAIEGGPSESINQRQDLLGETSLRSLIRAILLSER